MRCVKFFIAAGAASLLSSMALAADLPYTPQYVPPVEEFGGWYLRGDIGFSNQRIDSLDFHSHAGLLSLNQNTGFDTGGIFGVGVGYQFNNWLRADVTGQFRGKANFKGTDVFTFPVGGVVGHGIDNYNASKSELLFLANAYVDLGTWWGVTPFIGAGIGSARVSISNFTDNGQVDTFFNPPSVPVPITGSFPGSATATDASKWNFAWALHTGLAYKVSPNLTIELGYSYVDFGSGTTGNVASFNAPTLGNKFTFNNITSHDVKFGVRWELEAPTTYAPPLIRKG
jgi:opacity protein-like surface antigen